MPSAFSLREQRIHLVLQQGSDKDGAKARITILFQKNKSAEEIAAHLKDEYIGGVGFKQPDGSKFAAWFADEGIRICDGEAAQYKSDTEIISWTAAAENIRMMLQQGTYITKDELLKLESFETQQIAESIWYLRQNLDFGNDKLPGALDADKIIPFINRLYTVFPESTGNIAEQLTKPESRKKFISELQALQQEIIHEPRLVRFRLSSTPAEIIQSIQELDIPRIEFISNLQRYPQESTQFITQDEIDMLLLSGSNIAGGKARIAEFYQQDGHTTAEKADFLKEEYGEGGKNPALHGEDSTDTWHGPKGIRLKKGQQDDEINLTSSSNKSADMNVFLPWTAAARRLEILFASGRYTFAQRDIEDFHTTHEPVKPEPVPVGEEEQLTSGKAEPVPVDEEEQLTLEKAEPVPVGKEEQLTLGKAEPVPVDEEEQLTLEKAEPVPVGKEEQLTLGKAEPVPVDEEEQLTSGKAEPVPVGLQNHKITVSDAVIGGAKVKYKANVAAIQLLKTIQNEKRSASAEEQQVLARYSGWGGIADAFDQSKETWRREYAELRELLTSEEYAAARASTLNAHYTEPDIIQAMYEGIENIGLKPNSILEPACGTGRFFGCLPESMQNCKLHGIELDSITGQIAQQLYPAADIEIKGFEESSVRDNTFDLAIGNVPFGDYEVADTSFKEKGFLIHDYFFAKAIQKVRPGGIIAFITSSGTMDKKNSTVRKYINQRTRFLGAVRLPNTAFSAAGTAVTSDIIFLQKRKSTEEERDRHAWADPADGVQTGTLDGVSVNRYFAENPRMVLGTMKMVSGPYGMTATCEANGNLGEQLHTAVQLLDPLNTGKQRESAALPYGVIEQSAVKNELWLEENQTFDFESARPFSYLAHNGVLYFKEANKLVTAKCSQKECKRIIGMTEIRDITRSLIDAQVDGAPDENIHSLQKALNAKYDAFTAQYGLLSSKENKSAFAKDSSYPLLRSLEKVDDKDRLKEKAAIFTKRTIEPAVPITSVDTASEALAVSLREKAKVDLLFMSQLLGGEGQEKVVEDLQGVIYRDFAAGDRNFEDDSVQTDTCPYVTADEYLSGNVREKLEKMRELLPTLPNRFQLEAKQNVLALEKIQPVPLSAGEIHVRVGTPWIDKQYYQQFLYDLLKTPFYMQEHDFGNNNDKIRVLYSSATGEWNITNKSTDRNNVLAGTTYGTTRYNAYALFDTLLNQRMVRVNDTIEDADGKKKSVLNQKETAAAQEKADTIDEQFQSWIWKDSGRRNALCDKYNRMFNSTRPREYDGSHLQFVGMNKEIELRPHQLNAVARMLYSNRNTLLAHVVGAGKTYEMIAAIMESKRLGLCKKAMVIVPNHLTEQWGEDFVTLYPGANILVAAEKDFTPQNRKIICSRIATGDYDAVIIGHSQFEKIPLSNEEQQGFIKEQLHELEMGLEELKEDDAPRFSVKQIEKSKKNLEVRLKGLKDAPHRDDVITFEEMGIDRLYVDEAHNYKNLYYFTKMSNVAGIAQTDAQKSSDLFMKVRYLDKVTNNHGTVFATGTPISNSMVEMYTMQRYLQYNDLKGLGMLHFDNWAANFGQKEVAMELRPEGAGYRAKTRFSKFYNLPELMSLWHESADIKTADMLNLETPEAEYVTVETKPSEYQKEYLKSLSERAELVRNGQVDSTEDNMLCITNDGRKLALDQRLINSSLPDDLNSKVNACVNNIFAMYQETTERLGAQMVFCDLSTPGKEGFNVYDDVKDKLIQHGVPKDEIAFIHDAKTSAAKDKLFAQVRSGKVRVLIGSTFKMGAGTNAQDKLVAEHHLDCPWRPADLQQREGRILRQGNENKKVKIFRYVTKDTFDAYSWSIIENKQKFIGQVMTSKSPARSVDDVDATALSYAEVKACATGDPRIKEKMELDMAVAKLKMLKSSFDKQHYDMEDRVNKYYPKKICEAKEAITGFTEDKKTLDAHPEDRENFSMKIAGQLYSKRAEAGKALANSYGKAKKECPHNIELGEYRGFKLYMGYSFDGIHVIIKGKMSQTVGLETFGTDYVGNIIRIKNGTEAIPQKIEAAKNLLEDYTNQLSNAQEEVKKVFPHAAELKEKSVRLSKLTAELSVEENHPSRNHASVMLPDGAGTELHIRKAFKQMGVSDSTVDVCVDAGMLYEDKACNAIFVQRNSDGDAVAAKRYSMLTDCRSLGWIRGSDEEAGWQLCNDSQTLIITDTPVTAMCVMSKYDQRGRTADFLAVGTAGADNNMDSQKLKINNVLSKNSDIQTVKIVSTLQNAQQLLTSVRHTFPEKECRIELLKDKDREPINQAEEPSF